MPESVQVPRRLAVLGLPVHLLEDYPGWLIQRLNQRQGVHVVTLNAEMSMMAEQNAALAEVIKRANLVIPDGAGIVFYLWLRGQRVRRHPGIELAETLLRRSLPDSTNPASPDRPLKVFFYGGAPGVCQSAAEVWQQKVPGLAIAGTQHGYLIPEEQLQFRQTLESLQPDIILVGLGVPRQELWIAEHQHLCPAAVWIGVGGSFDIWSGTKTRAPVWLRENHLEWVYRLYQEPWRWRRMLALPRFALRALVHSRG